VLATCSTLLQAAARKGWFIAGSKLGEYESGLDASAVHNDHPSAYLKAKVQTSMVLAL
jgi:hypothetical protein